MSHLAAPPSCRFSAIVGSPCRDSAVGLFDVDAGCACFPDDRGEQAYCAQHVARASPIGSMVLVEAYDPAVLLQLGYADLGDGTPL